MQIVLTSDTPSIRFLCEKDKRLAKLMSLVGPLSYSVHEDGFAFLIAEIIEQMLSVKAAHAIFSRLKERCRGAVTPQALQSLTDDDIKSCGTSVNKVKTIRRLCEALAGETLVLEDLPHCPDQEVMQRLTAVWGLGQWTAKMYLLFVLDRSDILPYEDVAFLQTYKWLYKTTDTAPVAVQKKCRKWRPYSSVAARYMYRALDLGLTRREFHLFKA
ncbi:MAG: DNA-3-methyladenine glycosylase 2 family protein [Succinivibrio sp.]|nr:DNA-3-methyladenine glycosylase 2 family protein [Succinivibrio sp.]